MRPQCASSRCPARTLVTISSTMRSEKWIITTGWSSWSAHLACGCVRSSYPQSDALQCPTPHRGRLDTDAGAPRRRSASTHASVESMQPYKPIIEVMKIWWLHVPVRASFQTNKQGQIVVHQWIVTWAVEQWAHAKSSGWTRILTTWVGDTQCLVRLK
jgi:hypothetical protein